MSKIKRPKNKSNKRYTSSVWKIIKAYYSKENPNSRCYKGVISFHFNIDALKHLVIVYFMCHLEWPRGAQVKPYFWVYL